LSFEGNNCELFDWASPQKTIDFVRLSPAVAGLNDLVVEFLGLRPRLYAVTCSAGLKL
jgi:hypothetical protein